MKLTPDQINSIRNNFALLQSKEDLLNLLNITKSYKYGIKSQPFELRQLNFYINTEDTIKRNRKDDNKLNSLDSRYSVFKIKKKSGGLRLICAPQKGLKTLQSCLNTIFHAIYSPHQAATGFVPGRSIVDNAKVHVGSHYVYNIDLKDFFPSIDKARLWARLQQPPFNLSEKRGSIKIASMIAGICCTEMEVERKVLNDQVVRFNQVGELKIVRRSVLPQGAPTSPIITNIICEKMDHRLSGLAKRFQLRYSRYADDITFSSMHNVFNNDSKFIAELHRIIGDQNFVINNAKTRLQKQGYRQEVTGLNVNVHPNVRSSYIKVIRKWLYLWERYGLERAETIFMNDYIQGKSKDKNIVIPSMIQVIAGKLVYLKMVKGKESLAIQKLQNRLVKLVVSTVEPLKKKSLNIKNEVVERLDLALAILMNKGQDGLAEAMELYSNARIYEA